jgi:hypothetical protein
LTEQGLGAFPGKFFDTLLQLRNHLRVLVGEIGFLIRVLYNIEQLYL